MTKVLTVFTPTYNRAYCLEQVYQSLVRQSNSNFIWLIIDDGSTDNTKQVVETWIKQGRIEISYVFQKNQGMHGAHNTAYDNIKTELNVCIDSDDYMPDNGVEIILKHADGLNKKDCAGLIALDADKYGRIIGTKIPEALSLVKLSDLYLKHGIRGDKKLVLFTEVARSVPPYPLFPGENFVPLDYKYLLIEQKFNFKSVNEVACIVEYQPDGSTMNIFRQYRNNPKGFSFSRISRINYGTTILEKFKNCIHLVSSTIFSKVYSDLFKTRFIALIILAIPFGCILNLYVRFKTK
jgi:glycosyltransferase involved in cell wall biosynthesis